MSKQQCTEMKLKTFTLFQCTSIDLGLCFHETQYYVTVLHGKIDG